MQSGFAYYRTLLRMVCKDIGQVLLELQLNLAFNGLHIVFVEKFLYSKPKNPVKYQIAISLEMIERMKIGKLIQNFKIQVLLLFLELSRFGAIILIDIEIIKHKQRVNDPKYLVHALLVSVFRVLFGPDIQDFDQV